MKNDEVRNQYMTQFRERFAEETILQTASNELCIPCVDDEGNEGYLTIIFRIPKGSRDGEEYNGYDMAEEYARKCAEKEEKAKERAAAKEKKIAKDKALREKKSKEKETE